MFFYLFPHSVLYDLCPWRLHSEPLNSNGRSTATRWTIPRCALLLITVSQRGSPTTTPWKEPRARQLGRSWAPCKTIPHPPPCFPRGWVLKAGIMHGSDWGVGYGHVSSREKLRCHHLALLSIPFARARSYLLEQDRAKTECLNVSLPTSTSSHIFPCRPTRFCGLNFKNK